MNGFLQSLSGNIAQHFQVTSANIAIRRYTVKKWLPHIPSLILVAISFLAGSVLTGNNAIAQKITALSGSGTPGRLARWTSSSGGLGNSGVSEDKNGNLTLGGSVKFPDGSVQTTASTSHERLTFNLALGQSRVIQVPIDSYPFEVSVFVTGIVEESIAKPPLLLAVWIARDPQTGKVAGRAAAGDGLFPDCIGRIDDPPPGIVDCQRSGFLGAVLTIDPATGDLALHLRRVLGGDLSNDFPVYVNMSF